MATSAATTEPARRGPRRLLLRLYAIGIVTMMAVGATMVATRIFRDRWRRTTFARAALIVGTAGDWLEGGAAGAPATARAGMDAYLRRLRQDAEIALSVYDSGGRLVATNVDPALPVPAGDEIARLDAGARAVVRPGAGMIVPLRRAGVLLGYAVGHAVPPPHRRELAVDVPIALVWIGLAALMLSRMMGRPLERIASAARAFGRGDMSVRTGVDRNDEIGDVARAFDEMSERIAKLLEAQRELLAGVSHELRTPLSRIRVALDLAEEGDAETGRASLRDVAEDLTEIERVMDDIFSTARLELAQAGGATGGVPLNRADIAVAPLVDKAVSRVRGKSPGRSFVLEVDPAAAAGRVFVDAVWVRRAVENVIENAHKYSPPATPVTTAVRKEGDAYVIEVADRGFGIAPSDLPRVFSPFFRADRSRTRATGGVGLGLALAKRVIEAHGGAIELESELDVGTTVRFRLPASDGGAIAPGPAEDGDGDDDDGAGAPGGGGVGGGARARGGAANRHIS
jgi:signal transduction histidine kinase